VNLGGVLWLLFLAAWVALLVREYRKRVNVDDEETAPRNSATSTGGASSPTPTSNGRNERPFGTD